MYNICLIYNIFICIYDIHIVYILCKYYIFFPVFQLSCPYLYPWYLHPLILFQKWNTTWKLIHVTWKGIPAAFIMCAIKQCLISCAVLKIIYIPMLWLFFHNAEESWAGVFTALPWFAFPFGSCHDNVITMHIVRKWMGTKPWDVLSANFLSNRFRLCVHMHGCSVSLETFSFAFQIS